MSDRTSPAASPGVAWLAEREGCTPAELLADPRRALAALAAAGRDATDLADRRRSTDPETAAAADAEARALTERLAHDPGAALVERAIQGLRDLAAELSSRGGRPTAR